MHVCMLTHTNTYAHVHTYTNAVHIYTDKKNCQNMKKAIVYFAICTLKVATAQFPVRTVEAAYAEGGLNETKGTRIVELFHVFN